jgi:hypothetical protein
MIDCATATDLLLEAEPAELRGAGGSELAAHVRGCAACRGQAELLLAGQARLAHALDTLTSLHTAAVPARRPLWRWASRVLLPLAAAAAAMIVIVSRAAEPDGQALPPLVVPPARIAEVPVVNAGTARNVAVMRTSDPNITVVWYY